MTAKPAPFEPLGRRIRQLRVDRGWSQERLAEILDEQLLGETATQAAVSQWEAGTYAPSSQKLIALAETFGVELDELLRLRHGMVVDHVRPQSEAGEGENVVVLTEEEHRILAAGYNARIAKLPEHVRRTIDDIIDTYEADRS